jgi:hypothetical protein
MKTAQRLLSLAVLGLASLPLLAPSCTPTQKIQIFSPAGDVFEFSFGVQIQTPPGSTFDPATDVTLNGAPLPVSGSPSVYETTVNPGFPLQDANTLTVHAILANGYHVTESRQFQYLPPKARARQVADPDDLIEGPLAHGRVGDWLLENAAARFIVQDVAQRDLYSVGGFGGNVIDLELKSNPGNDNFIEIQPMLNLETVLNAQTIEVVNDGQDGTAAVLRVCGPDDLLDFVNPSSTIADAGITPPPGIDDLDQTVDACTEYRLEPQLEPGCESCGAPPWLRIETNVTNFGTQQVRMLVGDWYNPGGQLEAWARPERMGEALSNEFSTFSHFGYGEWEGVDYGYSTLPLVPSVPLQSQPNQFTTSGVSVLLHNASVIGSLLGQQPPFFVDPGMERSFARVLGVGDGSGANAVAMRIATRNNPAARVEGCVTVAGTPLAGSRVSVVRRDTGGGITQMGSSMVTRPGPCPNYGGTMQPGTNWELAASRRGTPYEGGLGEPTFHLFSVAADGTATVNVDLPATGRLEVQVEDEAGSPLPARVAVIGIDPSPPITAEGAFVPGFGGSLLGLFEDPKEGVPHGIVAFGYSGASGQVAFDVEPGSDYKLLVSRGTEYSVHQADLSISAGSTTSVNVQIARVLDTAGFVSSDFHVHGIRSADSRVADGPRVSQFAGEGVENIIMTDHHVHTDLTPVITALGLGNWVASTIGEEITTFDYGHFNGYPFTIDSSVPSGGSTDWGQAADPGKDFPSATPPAFNATPAQIAALATGGDVSTPDTTIQVNHIDSHFVPLQIDTSVAGPISDALDDAERLRRRLPSVASAGNLFHHFPALELWNGADRNQQNNFLNERIGIWMNHLNKGLRTTAISDTDTHTFGDLETAGARTWTAAPSDAVPGLSGAAVANAVDAGRAVGGQGLYVQTRLLAASTGQEANLTLGGSTDAATTDGAVELRIRVQAPTWARFDRVEVYANATTTPVNPATPYLFGATPTLTLVEGDCDPTTTGDGDFDITTVNVHPGVTGAQRQEVDLTVPFAGLTQDTWFAVIVKGTDGVCPSMFPVYPRSIDRDGNPTLADLLDGNVGEGTMALGVANALYLDVDPDEAPGFQPPNP